jgi:hypothetical protein
MTDDASMYKFVHDPNIRHDAELWLETVLAALAKKRFCLVKETTEMSPYKVVVTFSIKEITEGK